MKSKNFWPTSKRHGIFISVLYLIPLALALACSLAAALYFRIKAP